MARSTEYVYHVYSLLKKLRPALSNALNDSAAKAKAELTREGRRPIYAGYQHGACWVSRIGLLPERLSFEEDVPCEEERLPSLDAAMHACVRHAKGCAGIVQDSGACSGHTRPFSLRTAHDFHRPSSRSHTTIFRLPAISHSCDHLHGRDTTTAIDSVITHRRPASLPHASRPHDRRYPCLPPPHYDEEDASERRLLKLEPTKHWAQLWRSSSVAGEWSVRAGNRTPDLPRFRAHESAQCRAWTRAANSSAMLAHIEEVQQRWQAARLAAGMRPLTKGQLRSRRGYMLDFYHSQNGAYLGGAGCPGCAVGLVIVWKSANNFFRANWRVWTGAPPRTSFAPDESAVAEPAIASQPTRFQFTFVRDPLAHFLSGWSEFAWRHTGVKPRVRALLNMSLARSFVQALLDAQLPMLLDGCSPSGAGRPSLLQARHFYAMSGVLSSWRLDFVGRLESMRTDWDAVRQHLPSSRPFGAFDTQLGQHAASRDPHGHRAELEALLRDDERLLAGVCTLLFPDYACFGFSFAGCRTFFRGPDTPALQSHMSS